LFAGVSSPTNVARSSIGDAAGVTTRAHGIAGEILAAGAVVTATSDTGLPGAVCGPSADV
jgi:hypothetical protein